MKKGNFILSLLHKEVVDNLSDEEAGKLFKAIYEYASNQNETLTGSLQSVFIQFRNYIDLNMEKYLKKLEYDKKRYEEKKVENQIPQNSTKKKVKKSEMKWKNEISQISHNSYIITHNSLEEDNRGMGEEEETKADVELSAICKTIIEYLNKKINANFKSTTNSTIQKIKARLNEGYVLDDFIVVIDKKCLEWLNDEKMNKYLRPETLFSPKFESYLNQPAKKLTTKDIQNKIDFSDF